jgi:hypothetical protein
MEGMDTISSKVAEDCSDLEDSDTLSFELTLDWKEVVWFEGDRLEEALENDTATAALAGLVRRLPCLAADRSNVINLVLFISNSCKKTKSVRMPSMQMRSFVDWLILSLQFNGVDDFFC